MTKICRVKRVYAAQACGNQVVIGFFKTDNKKING